MGLIIKKKHVMMNKKNEFIYLTLSLQGEISHN